MTTNRGTLIRRAQTDREARNQLWAVVLAAGEGSRMAPLTDVLYGRNLPKQFAVLVGDRTFLQCTMRRIAPIIPSDRTVVVVSNDYEPLAREQLRSFPGVEVVSQPANRGTGPGVLLPLAHVRARDSAARVVVFPSDHHVRRPSVFLDAVRRAATAAESASSGISLVGAVSDRPATDLGWIVPGGIKAGTPRVERFVEKPPEVEAITLWKKGGLWNTMVAAGRVEAFWRLLRSHLPEHMRQIGRYLLTLGQPIARAKLDDAYRRMEPADFSRDVLQNAFGLSVVPMIHAGWSDCGTPERLLDSLKGTKERETLLARLRGTSSHHHGSGRHHKQCRLAPRPPWVRNGTECGRKSCEGLSRGRGARIVRSAAW